MKKILPGSHVAADISITEAYTQGVHTLLYTADEARTLTNTLTYPIAIYCRIQHSSPLISRTGYAVCKVEPGATLTTVGGQVIIWL